MAKTDIREPVTACTGVLEIKLGACLTGPTKRMVADLHAIALECNHARNAIVRHWERWREDNPDWQPAQRTGRGGVPKVTADGKPILENPCVSQETENALYHHGTAAAPNTAAKIIASCRAEVVDRLKSRLPWNHIGASHFRWEGILAHEVSRDCYRAICIPVPCQDTVLAIQTSDGVRVSRDLDGARIQQCARGGAILRFPLFSNKSGRDNKSIICRLETRQLTRGNRHVLARIASGDWKLSDSKLVWKEGKGRSVGKKGKSGKRHGRKRGAKRGAWFFQLTYKQPRIDLELDQSRTATFLPLDPDEGHPFEVKCDDSFPWRLGDVRVLQEQFSRLETRRMVLRNRYRDAGSAKAGHGRGQIERYIRPVTRMVRDLMERFTDHLVSEVIRYCRRNNCGKLNYQEPGLGRRQHLWFERRDIPYDWTSLMAKVAFKCEKYGLKLLVNGVDRRKRGQGRDAG